MPPQEPQQTPVPQPIAMPSTVGNTGIVDRSAMSGIYPDASATPPTATSTTLNIPLTQDGYRYDQASSSMNRGIVSVLGFGSSAGYLLAGYISKNSWIAFIVALILAGAAVYFGIKEYNRTKQLDVYTVIGLAGAAFTLIISVDYWILRAMLQSVLSSSSIGY